MTSRKTGGTPERPATVPENATWDPDRREWTSVIELTDEHGDIETLTPEGAEWLTDSLAAGNDERLLKAAAAPDNTELLAILDMQDKANGGTFYRTINASRLSDDGTVGRPHITTKYNDKGQLKRTAATERDNVKQMLAWRNAPANLVYDKGLMTGMYIRNNDLYRMLHAQLGETFRNANAPLAKGRPVEPDGDELAGLTDAEAMERYRRYTAAADEWRDSVTKALSQAYRNDRSTRTAMFHRLPQTLLMAISYYDADVERHAGIRPQGLDADDGLWALDAQFLMDIGGFLLTLSSTYAGNPDVFLPMIAAALEECRNPANMTGAAKAMRGLADVEIIEEEDIETLEDLASTKAWKGGYGRIVIDAGRNHLSQTGAIEKINLAAKYEGPEGIKRILKENYASRNYRIRRDERLKK